MNIIYFHTHDTGRYLDPANAPGRLPQLERCARSAVSFRRAHSAAPTCSPSRAALLTGATPHTVGMTGLSHRGFRLSDGSRHLCSYLAESGMERVLCGVQHVAPRKRELGYDRILDEPEDYFNRDGVLPHEWDLQNAARVADYLSAGRGRPFFLSFGLLSTHRPFPELPEGALEQSFPPPPEPVADTPETRRDMACFCEALGVVDEALGIVLDALEESRLAEDTALIVTTDHGPPFPEMKCTLKDGGTAVGLMMRVPGITQAGAVEHALVSHLDLLPTVCELAGVQAPAIAEGASLLPLLRGESASVRDALFAEINYHAVYEPARAVRTERYKLIRNFSGSLAPHPANVDDSPSKEVAAAAGYFNRLRDREELYDLLLDPAEGENLAAESAYAAVKDELRSRLEQWMRASDDPLLHGPVPRPAGARLNRQDAQSATEAADQ